MIEFKENGNSTKFDFFVTSPDNKLCNNLGKFKTIIRMIENEFQSKKDSMYKYTIDVDIFKLIKVDCEKDMDIIDQIAKIYENAGWYVDYDIVFDKVKMTFEYVQK